MEKSRPSRPSVLWRWSQLQASLSGQLILPVSWRHYAPKLHISGDFRRLYPELADLHGVVLHKRACQGTAVTALELYTLKAGGAGGSASCLPSKGSHCSERLLQLHGPQGHGTTRKAAFSSDQGQTWASRKSCALTLSTSESGLAPSAEASAALLLRTFCRLSSAVRMAASWSRTWLTNCWVTPATTSCTPGHADRLTGNPTFTRHLVPAWQHCCVQAAQLLAAVLYAFTIDHCEAVPLERCQPPSRL